MDTFERSAEGGRAIHLPAIYAERAASLRRDRQRRVALLNTQARVRQKCTLLRGQRQIRLHERRHLIERDWTAAKLRPQSSSLSRSILLELLLRQRFLAILQTLGHFGLQGGAFRHGVLHLNIAGNGIFLFL